MFLYSSLFEDSTLSLLHSLQVAGSSFLCFGISRFLSLLLCIVSLQHAVSEASQSAPLSVIGLPLLLPLDSLLERFSVYRGVSKVCFDFCGRLKSTIFVGNSLNGSLL